MPLSYIQSLCLQTNPLLIEDFMLQRNAAIDYQTNNNKLLTYVQNLRNNKEEFFNKVHVTVKVFDYILERIKPTLSNPRENKKTYRTNPDIKLFVCLRYLTGMSISQLRLTYGLSSQLYININDTMKTIWTVLSKDHMSPPKREDFTALEKRYYAKWGFPNCIGAIGAKFIKIQVIKKTTNIRLIAKKSVVLNAVVDADSRFLVFDTMETYMDPQSDWTFDKYFAFMGFKQDGSKIDEGPVLIGNQAYPLRAHLMRPYNRRLEMESDSIKRFNEKLQSSLAPIEMAFQILQDKWSLLNKKFWTNKERMYMIVRTCCLLHNITHDIDRENDIHFINVLDQRTSITDLHLITFKSRKNCRSRSFAMAIRDKFRFYFDRLESSQSEESND